MLLGENAREEEGEGQEQKEYKGKQRSIVSRGRLAGFHAGDAIENDTSTQHSRNTLALILISLFLVVS